MVASPIINWHRYVIGNLVKVIASRHKQALNAVIQPYSLEYCMAGALDQRDDLIGLVGDEMVSSEYH